MLCTIKLGVARRHSVTHTQSRGFSINGNFSLLEFIPTLKIQKNSISSKCVDKSMYADKPYAVVALFLAFSVHVEETVNPRADYLLR